MIPPPLVIVDGSLAIAGEPIWTTVVGFPAAAGDLDRTRWEEVLTQYRLDGAPHAANRIAFRAPGPGRIAVVDHRGARVILFLPLQLDTWAIPSGIESISYGNALVLSSAALTAATGDQLLIDAMALSLRRDPPDRILLLEVDAGGHPTSLGAVFTADEIATLVLIADPAERRTEELRLAGDRIAIARPLLLPVRRGDLLVLPGTSRDVFVGWAFVPHAASRPDGDADWTWFDADAMLHALADAGLFEPALTLGTAIPGDVLAAWHERESLPAERVRRIEVGALRLHNPPVIADGDPALPSEVVTLGSDQMTVVTDDAATTWQTRLLDDDGDDLVPPIASAASPSLAVSPAPAARSVRVVATTGAEVHGVRIENTPLVINRVWMFAPMTTLSTPEPITGEPAGVTWLDRFSQIAPTDVVISCNDRGNLRVNDALPISEANVRFHFISPGGDQAEKRDRITARANELHALGITPHLMVWLFPFESFIRDTAEALIAICEAAPIGSIVLDLEEAWRGGGDVGPLRHGLSVAHYGDVVEEHFIPAFTALRDSRPGLRVGASDITMIGGFRDVLEPLVAACDYTMPQAYSSSRGFANCVADGNTPAECRVWRPGVTQRSAWSQWRGFDRTMVMLLNAYAVNGFSNGPHVLTTAESMLTMIRAVEGLAAPEVREIGYWAMNTLYTTVGGANETTAVVNQRRAFMATLCASVRAQGHGT